MYRAPNVHEPSKELLKETAQKLKLDISEPELDVCKELVHGWLDSYERVAQCSEPLLPVNFPRCNPVKPEPEDNPNNAWSHKITIPGASAGLLHGKTLAVKDCIPICGVPMVNGTNLMDKYVPDFDATVVDRALTAGAVIKGTSNTEDMCFSGSSLTCCHGPILNPVDKTRSAGGSSSGSGVLVALGEVDMALGGDQGGSIRIPSSWCGIVGLKPTYGLVPYTGIAAIEPSMDHVGPMAKTVKDCALLLQAIAGHDDGLDFRQAGPMEMIDYPSKLTGNISELKIGVLTEGFEGCDTDVVQVVQDMVTKLGGIATVENVSLPFHKDGVHIWSPVCLEGGFKTMLQHGAAGTGMKGFYPTSLMEHITKAYEVSKNDMSMVMKPLAVFGTYMQDAYRGRFYAKASNLIIKLTRQYNEALKKYNVLIMPTLPYVAPKLPSADTPVLDRVRHALGMIRNTAVFNATGHPALSINAGVNKDSLPVGLMIVGKHHDDQTVLRVAQAVETLNASG